jgi:DNA-binding MarR family transcriptional regulator
MTEAQYRVLSLLESRPKKAPQMAELLGITIDATHGRLRRLEDKDWVRRVQLYRDDPIEWELTRQGRKALSGYSS